MKIKSIIVRGLHRSIDADLEFQPDLGIIVGINGAGKTSIINLTAHLLRLNIPELLRLEFELIEISGEGLESKSVSIRAVKTLEGLKINAKRGGRNAGDFFCPLLPAGNHLEHRPEELAAWERYLRRTTIEIATTPLAEFLRKNVRLTLVKLDRTLFAEDYTGNVAIDQPVNVRFSRRQGGELDPISQVERATRERFTEYQGQLKRLNEELTNKIVLQLFQAPDIFSEINLDRQTTTEVKQISKLEGSIKKTSFYPKNQVDQESISEYFRLTKMIAKNFSSLKSSKSIDSDVWQQRFMVSALGHLDRLNTLAKEFNDFDNSVNDAYKGVGDYLNAINGFLIESSKEAFFSGTDNTLRFRISGDNDDLVGRPISELSSGEKQILTLLAYLAYLAGENSIFLIDEPELSLHISWQTGLLAALKSVQPKGCQLIMATHSPEIVGDERGKVVRLIPQYRPIARKK